MKCKLHTLLCLSLLLIFSACGQDDDPIPPEKASRTVLAYFAADNTLSGFAAEDIDEMMEGMKQVDAFHYNLLAYVDGRNSSPTLYHIYKDKKGNVVKEAIKEYEEQVSTDVSVMQEVVHRAFTEYPADSYGLVFWSHGDGWIPEPLPQINTRWIGQDLTDGENYLNISGLVSVLEKIPHLDFILFDACFCQAIEVAYELREYVDYIIGSPTEIPGPGASYDKVVPAMFASENVVTEIAKAYYEPYAETYDEKVAVTNEVWTGGVSVAVVKCAALDELASVTNQLLSEAGPELATLRDNVYNYDKRSGNLRYKYVGYYDMKQLMQYLAVDISTWNSALDKTILSWNTTPMNFSAALAKNNFAPMDGRFSIPLEETCGVSHYIPTSTTSAAAAAYRHTAWYNAAGLSKLDW